MADKTLFPTDDYTPNGYIDNPFHCFRLNPSGVIRSKPAMGFGWFVPHLARGYGRRFIYSSHLNIGIEIDGKAFVDFGDFKKHKVRLTSKYHSKNIVSFDFSYKDVQVSVSFLQPLENSVSAVASVRNLSSANRKIRFFAINNYTRNKETAGLMEEGLTSCFHSDLDALETKPYSEGTAMLTRADMRSTGHALFRNDSGAKAHIAGKQGVKQQDVEYLTSFGATENTITGVLEYQFSLKPKGSRKTTFVLSRAETENEVRAESSAAFKVVQKAMDCKIAEDNNFWKKAVQLLGTFPPHWRRGFVYDTETLRMNVRKPVGIYKHVWDAMQIQAPRSVLAEACFDAILLSYSDPELAKELLLGTFVDAPEDWIPCTRENGSYNMIASNGFPCGTAPEWGAPLWVVESVYRRTNDKTWLRKIYPRMAAYMTWWLNNRTDDEGFAHYLCSYESGQDMSGRFGHQLGGGYDVTHVRAVDLMAAMWQSFLALEFFAKELGLKKVAKEWAKHAENFEQKTQSLWCKDGWFHDYDRREKEFTDDYDVMHLGPFFYGMATDDQCRQVQEKVKMWCLGSRPHWATFTLMLVESAFNTGMRQPLSSLAGRLVDYIYSSIDMREQEPAMPLPGIQHEFWPSSRTWGAEGYGWGCFSVFLVIRTMFGFREAGDDTGSFMLCPSLPEKLMKKGEEYRVSNLKYRNLVFDLKYSIQSRKTFKVQILFKKGHDKISVKVFDAATSDILFEGTPRKNGVIFNAENLKDYTIIL